MSSKITNGSQAISPDSPDHRDQTAAHGSFQEVVHAPLVGADPDECSVDTCGAVLRSALEYLGAEAHVTTEKPLVAGSHPPVGMECPHGRVWYGVPTSEQVAQWAEDGVE